MTLLGRQKQKEGQKSQPEAPQEGAGMLLFLKPGSIPAPSNSSNGRRRTRARRRLRRVPTEQKTLKDLGEKKTGKEKHPPPPPTLRESLLQSKKNNLSSTSLHPNAAITWLPTAVSSERWKSAHSLAFLLSPGQQPLHEVLLQHVVHRAAVIARQRGLRVASVHRSGAGSPYAEAAGRAVWSAVEE